MAEVRDHGVTNEQIEGQLMDLRTAADIMLRCINVTASVQAHVHAADNLAGTAWRIMLFDDFHFELHVLLEPGRRAHAEIFWV